MGTRTGPRELRCTQLIAYFAGALALFGILYGIDRVTSKGSVATQGIVPGKSFELNGVKINLLIADTEAKRVQGLSGHAPLAQNEAMLFVFPNESDWGIWMKDMIFPLDILWLDKDMRVITAEQNVSPATYPNVFRPNTPALYVIEANAGFIERNRIVYQEQLKIK